MEALKPQRPKQILATVEKENAKLNWKGKCHKRNRWQMKQRKIIPAQMIIVDSDENSKS